MKPDESARYAELAEKADKTADDMMELIVYFSSIKPSYDYDPRVFSRLDDALSELNSYLASVGACAERVRLMAVSAQTVITINEARLRNGEHETMRETNG